MKKTSFLSLLILASVAALFMSSCQKDTTTLRLRFDDFGGNSKVWIDGRTPKWNSGDPVWINENRVEVASTATTITVASAASYRAVYPYDIVTSANGNTFNLSIPQEQIYSEVNNKQMVKAPMVAYTTSNTLTFRNLGALLAITVQNNTTNASYAIKEIRVKSKNQTLPLWGTASIDITSPNASLQCGDATGNNVDPYTVYLRKYGTNNQQVAIYTFNANSGDDSYKTFYVYVPVHGNINNSFRIEVVPMSGTTVWREQSSATGGNLDRNQLVSVPFELRRVVAPTGAVPEGKFKINSDGSQVYFAAGNLQYQCSTEEWRIAPHQWDYIGNGSSFTNVNYGNNASIANGYNGWIDLFGWGTSGYHADNNNTRYHPYSWDNDGSSSTSNGYGPSSGYSLTGNYANCDWGVYHSNTTNTTHGSILQYNGANVEENVAWRTLTSNEWKYLLQTREVNGGSGEGHTFSRVRLVQSNQTTRGFLIYPDNYLSQVANDAEINAVPEGCVFLPVTGERAVSTDDPPTPVINNNTYGYYWSSSGVARNPLSAYRQPLQYISGGSIEVRAVERYVGCAVRLVTPVQ